MPRVPRTRTQPPAWRRALASLLSAPIIAFGLVATFSAGTGSAGASTASTSSDYGGGQMMTADPTGGYWTATAVGAVTPHDGAPALGSPAASELQLAEPIVGMAATPDGGGYWLVAGDGGIFSYGDARFYGSAGGMHLNEPIVGMAATNDGNGYWLVASDGGIFSYGDAAFLGSTGSLHLNRPIVGMAATSDGAGYWLVASDGGIFNYGDAAFHGSAGSIVLNKPVVGMAPTPDGAGYWLVAADGGVFTFGDAGYDGSTSGTGVGALGIVVDPAAPGYAIVTTSGSASAFGTRAPPVSTQLQSSPSPTQPLTPTTPRSSAPATRPAAGLQQGAYVASDDPARMAAFAAATKTSPTIASEYLPGNAGWTGMDGSDGSLGWLLAPWQGSDYTLSLGVPIIPTANGLPVGTLAQGATGAFNFSYVTLARTLVSAGQSDAYLRLGWEFDGSWFPWAATTPSAEADFAAYFRQIVTAMRSVPGENFRFVWNPDAGAFTTPGFSVGAAYPGNAYVNAIGLDVYDESWSTKSRRVSWSSADLPALTAARQFAAANGEPLAVCEWGVAIRTDSDGFGDDPHFVNHMASWMLNPSNDVIYEAYLDAHNRGMNARITGPLFPKSLAAFIADLG